MHSFATILALLIFVVTPFLLALHHATVKIPHSEVIVRTTIQKTRLFRDGHTESEEEIQHHHLERLKLVLWYLGFTVAG